MKHRIIFIDNMKGIGIFLVLIGHNFLPKYLHNLIYSVHMPLFFFLSGYLFKPEDIGIIQYIRKKVRSLIIPYIFFSILGFLFWLVVAKNFGNDAAEYIVVKDAILGVILVNSKISHTTPFWFLISLCLIEIFYFISHKFDKEYLLLIPLLFFIVYNQELVFKLRATSLAIPFFFQGVATKRYQFDKLIFKNKIKSIIFFFLFFLIIFPINTRVDMNLNVYGNLFFFYLTAFSGINLLMLISKLISRRKILSFLGQQTLYILGYHLIILSVLKGVQALVFKIDLGILKNSILLSITYAILEILCILPMINLTKLCFERLGRDYEKISGYFIDIKH